MLEITNPVSSDVLYTLSQSLDGENASFWRLPHPRTGCPALFLPYISREGQQQRVLEVQAVSPTNGRSWFLQEQVIEGMFSFALLLDVFHIRRSDGKLLLFTPIDPAFLLIPILQFGCPVCPICYGSLPKAECLVERRRPKQILSPRRSL